MTEQMSRHDKQGKDNRSAVQDEGKSMDKDKPGNNKDTQRQKQTLNIKN
jgi:hypothetical protein